MERHLNKHPWFFIVSLSLYISLHPFRVTIFREKLSRTTIEIYIFLDEIYLFHPIKKKLLNSNHLWDICTFLSISFEVASFIGRRIPKLQQQMPFWLNSVWRYFLPAAFCDRTTKAISFFPLYRSIDSWRRRRKKNTSFDAFILCVCLYVWVVSMVFNSLTIRCVWHLIVALKLYFTWTPYINFHYSVISWYFRPINEK